MPASMPSSNSPYPTAPLALLIDSPGDQKSINNNCNGAVSDSTTATQHDPVKYAHRNPTSTNRKQANMNFQMVCITVTLVICCIVIAGLEIWNSMQTWKLQAEVNGLHERLATLQTNFDQLKNSTTSFDRNASDNVYDEEYYDDDYEDEGDDIVRNDRISSSMSSSSKLSFDGETTDYVDPDDGNLPPGLPLSEDEFDATETEQTERNETVKRTSRSVSPRDNGIPVIDGTYAENRMSIDQAHGIAVHSGLHRLDENRASVPRFHHDWSDRGESTASRKYPKKYESATDETSVPEHRQHRHRHHHEQHERKLTPQSQSQTIQPQRFASVDPPPPMPETIDFSNLYARPSLEQDMQSGSSQLNEEIIRHTDAFQPKPRRRVLRPPPSSTPNVRAARSPLHSSGMRFKTIAVHYHGDTSAYMTGGHVSPHHLERFDGNGRIRHPGGIYSDWKPAYWVDEHAMERFFVMHQGVVTVKEHGLYYIYAQIFYHDDHDTNGYIVEHNSEPLYQCTTATHSNQRVTKSNTCHTAGINYLNAGDRIHIKDLGSHRYTLFDASKSFFGLIKVGDLRGSSNQPTSLPNT